MKKNIIPIAIIAALSFTACTSEAIDPTPTTSTVQIAPPPSFSAGGATRATINTDLTTQWQTGDQLQLTAIFHHPSGLTETQELTPVTYTGTAWPSITITWPVANIAHATITATITGVGTNPPSFLGTAKVKPGDPITITFGTDAHRTAAIRFNNLLAGDVIKIPALNITHTLTADGQKPIFYFTPPPAANKLTGTAAGKPFTIELGENPLGKIYEIKAGGHTAGGTTFEEIIETNRFMAWADKVRDGDLSADFNLMSDINLAGINWTPIGRLNNGYTGTFNGNGYTITGLKIDASDNRQGLFGQTNGAVLANVTIKNPDIRVTDGIDIGSLVGRADATTISHCSVEGGEIIGHQSVGGLAGTANSTHITGCYADVTITATGSNVGGLVGYNWSSSTIAFCYATGDVKGGSGIGGLVGVNDNSTISSCYATGDVTGNVASTGSLVGTNTGTTTVEYCCATGLVNNGAATVPAGNSTEIDIDFLRSYPGEPLLRMYDPTAANNYSLYKFTSAIWKSLTEFDWDTPVKQP